jgi:hypothetical protein
MNGFSILVGAEDPNGASASASVQAAAVDYCYFRLGTGSAATWLYRCDVSAVFGAGGVLTSAAHWTAK